MSKEGGTVLVAALGDSITAGTPLWDPDAGIRERLAGPVDERSQFEYWAEQENPRLRFRNCGVDGETAEEIARRFDACVDGADVLIVQGGINDIVRGNPLEEAERHLRTMVRAGVARAIPVFVTDVLPWNNGHPDADPKIEALNAAIRRIAADEGATLLPFHDTLEDPERPGTMRADWTDDGNHPSIEGHRRLGALVAEIVGGVVDGRTRAGGTRESASGAASREHEAKPLQRNE